MKCLILFFLGLFATFVAADNDDPTENLFVVLPFATSLGVSPRHGGISSYPSVYPSLYHGGNRGQYNPYVQPYYPQNQIGQYPSKHQSGYGQYPSKQYPGYGKYPSKQHSGYPHRPSRYPSNNIVHFPNRQKHRPSHGQYFPSPGKYPGQSGYPGQGGVYPIKTYPTQGGIYPGQTFPNQIGSYPIKQGIYPVQTYPGSSGYQKRPGHHSVGHAGSQLGSAIGSLIGGVLNPQGYGPTRGRPVIGVVRKPGRRRYGYSRYALVLR